MSSVAQLPQLVQVGAAELVPHPAGQHLQDQHREQHVEGGAELDDEREPAVARNATAAMPLSSEQEADDLGDGLAAG